MWAIIDINLFTTSLSYKRNKRAGNFNLKTVFYKHFNNMEIDHSIEVFRLKRLFHRLQNAKITGSVVTIVIPPKKNVSEMSNKLLE